MAAKPETTFIRSVHRHLPVDVYWEKMNNQYRGGTADVWYSGVFADIWIEYKYLAKVPVRADIVPTKLLSPLQVAWLTGRRAENRKVFVVIGCEHGGVILPDWLSPIKAADFTNLVLSRKELAREITLQTLGANYGCESHQRLPGVRVPPTPSRKHPANLRRPV